MAAVRPRRVGAGGVRSVPPHPGRRDLAAVGGFEAVRRRGGGGRRAGARVPRPPGGRCAASAAATRCASACTPTGSAIAGRGVDEEPRRRRGAGPRGRPARRGALGDAPGWRSSSTPSPSPRSAVGGGLDAPFAAQLWWMLRRLGSFHWLTAVAVPDPAARLRRACSLGRSVLARCAGRVRWRGAGASTSAAPSSADGLPLLVDLSALGDARWPTSSAWARVHAGTGYVAHRLPRRPAASATAGCSASARSSAAGASTERLRHPAVEGPPPGGRRALRRRDQQAPPARRPRARSSRETRRAELGHWWAMACGPGVRALEPARWASSSWSPTASSSTRRSSPIQRYNRRAPNGSWPVAPGRQGRRGAGQARRERCGRAGRVTAARRRRGRGRAGAACRRARPPVWWWSRCESRSHSR